MVSTWGVDIEESNNFVMIYIVIFAMTYAVTNVSCQTFGKIRIYLKILYKLYYTISWSPGPGLYLLFRPSSWSMNWLFQQ